MKNKLFFLTFVFFFTTLSAQEKSIDQNQIFKNLRCLVCQGQTVHDSNSDFAFSRLACFCFNLDFDMSTDV